jgi:hypothetical protein
LHSIVAAKKRTSSARMLLGPDLRRLLTDTDHVWLTAHLALRAKLRLERTCRQVKKVALFCTRLRRQMRKSQSKDDRRLHLRKKVENGLPINRRELADLLEISYATVRKWKWLPVIPGINKFFFEHFWLMIEKKHGLCDEEERNRRVLTQQVIQWANDTFSKGTARPGWSRYAAQRRNKEDAIRAHNEVRKILAAHWEKYGQPSQQAIAATARLPET